MKELTRPTALVLLPFSLVILLWANSALPNPLGAISAISFLLNLLVLAIRLYFVSCSTLVDEEGRVYFQYRYKDEKIYHSTANDESEQLVAIHHHRFFNYPNLEEWIFLVFASSSRLLVFDRCANANARAMTPLEVKELLAKLSRTLDCPVIKVEGRERPEPKRESRKQKEEQVTSFEVVTVRGSKEWRLKVALLGQLAYVAPLLVLAYGAYRGINAIYPMTLLLLMASWWVSETPLALFHYLRHTVAMAIPPLLPTEVLTFDLTKSQIYKRFENWHRASTPKEEFTLEMAEIACLRLTYAPYEELSLIQHDGEVLPLVSRDPKSALFLGDGMKLCTVEPLARQITQALDIPLVVEVKRG